MLMPSMVGWSRAARRFIDARKDRGAVEWDFGVTRAAALGNDARERRFVVGGAGESEREAGDACLGSSGEHGDGAGIETARKKQADGDVGDEMGFDGAFQKRAEVAGGGGKSFGTPGIASGGTASGIVPGAGARDAAAFGNVQQHFVARRQRENAVEEGDRLGYRPKRR